MALAVLKSFLFTRVNWCTCHMYGPHYGKGGPKGGKTDNHTGRSDRKPPAWSPETAHVYPLRNWIEDLQVWCNLTHLSESQQGYAVFMELGGLANDKICEATRTQATGMAFLSHSRDGQETVDPDNAGHYLSGVDIIVRMLSQTLGSDMET